MRKFLMTNTKYFLTPVCLVPNGRAHLGHIAGPLLKMDVLRRHLLLCGASVHMISLSDAHESHVPIRAHQNRTTPEDIANRFHDLIAADLKTLAIDYDAYINPLDPEWSERYELINRALLREIKAASNSVVRNEAIPHLEGATGGEPCQSSLRPRIGDPVVSGWLKGRCPFCGQPLVGFFCENCGGAFAPHEMQDISTAHFDGMLTLKERPSVFLELHDGVDRVKRQLRSINVRPDFLALADRYMEKNGVAIRLTVPSPWGIEVTDEMLADNEVIWSYSALLYGCHLVAGERYKELTGSDVNPLEAGSDVTCILAFGMDNAVPFLVGATGCALGQRQYKPFDGMLVNYFYDLEGAKFSTSRGHVIWAGDMVSLGGADADLVRAYLCYRNPEFSRANFDVAEFLEFHNATARELYSVLHDAFAHGSGYTALDDGVLRYLECSFAAQSASLSVSTFDIANAYAIVEQWKARAQALISTPNSAYTWICGFALLASPIMPTLASWVWSQISAGEELTLLAFLSRNKVCEFAQPHGSFPLRTTHLSRAEFNACLPPRLRH